MIIIWAIMLLSSDVIGHEVYENVEENDHEYNTTTLYPRATNNATEIPHAQRKHRNQTQSAEGQIKSSATTWNIDSSYVEPKIEDSNSTESKEEPAIKRPEKNESKPFKPSPHFGDFFDFDSEEEPPPKQFGRQFPSIKKPASGFKFPKDFKHTFDSDVKTKNGWKVARPITVHAGDLYKLPDAFKEGPDPQREQHLNSGTRDEFPEHGVKKKVNPWHGLLRLMTAFIPVGLIISALTPSVLTIENTGLQTPPRLYRRSDAAENIAEISERCRRRLLCELHAQKQYLHVKSKSDLRLRSCARYQCEDPGSISELISWMVRTDGWPITQNTRGDVIT